MPIEVYDDIPQHPVLQNKAPTLDILCELHLVHAEMAGWEGTRWDGMEWDGSIHHVRTFKPAPEQNLEHHLATPIHPKSPKSKTLNPKP